MPERKQGSEEATNRKGNAKKHRAKAERRRKANRYLPSPPLNTLALGRVEGDTPPHSPREEKDQQAKGTGMC